MIGIAIDIWRTLYSVAGAVVETFYRLTESGDRRVTEVGDPRVTE